jgi:hypothetical protein
MAVAIACCIVAYFAYEYQTGLTEIHTNGAQIYRVSAIREFDHQTTKYGYAPLPLRGIVSQNFKDVDSLHDITFRGPILKER